MPSIPSSKLSSFSSSRTVALLSGLSEPLSLPMLGGRGLAVSHYKEGGGEELLPSEALGEGVPKLGLRGGR